MKRFDMRHLASLARLSLEREEEEDLARDLEKALAFFQALARLDTEGVEPAPHPFSLTSRPREDRQSPGLSRDQALSNAPDRDGPFFRLPPVLEEEPRQ